MSPGKWSVTRSERVGEIERAISVWRVETCCSAKVLLSVVDSYRTPVNGTELKVISSSYNPKTRSVFGFHYKFFELALVEEYNLITGIVTT